LAHFTADGGAGEAAFAAPYPGTIHALEIGQRQWLCQRHSFLCCSPGVTLSVALSQKLGYGLFSGEGFILQTLGGQGDALVHAGGHFIRMDLAAGEQGRVDTGRGGAAETWAQWRERGGLGRCWAGYLGTGIRIQGSGFSECRARGAGWWRA